MENFPHLILSPFPSVFLSRHLRNTAHVLTVMGLQVGKDTSFLGSIDEIDREESSTNAT